MNQALLAAVVTASAAFVGALSGAVASYLAARRTYRLEQAKVLASWNKSSEVESARIAAYVQLWKCLGPISTHNPPTEIVSGLPEAQRRLHEWYYEHGGGLLLTGSARDLKSTKAAFFVARDLRSVDPIQIWQVFHELRRAIRRDLGVFESDADEVAALEQAKKRLGSYAR